MKLNRRKDVAFEDITDEASGLTVRKTEWVEGAAKVSQTKRPLTEEEVAELLEELRIDGSNG